MKNLLTSFLMILLWHSSTAQDSRYECGLQIGPNLAHMRYASPILQSNRHAQIAGTAGIFFQYNINKMFSLRTDPAYEQLAEKSGQITVKDAYANIIATGITYFRYNYITIPILLRASIGNKLTYFLNAGPSLGFLFNQNSVSDWATTEPTINNTHQYKTLNFGITTGIGIALPIKEAFSLSLELRNNFGLSNISVNSNDSKAFKSNTTSLLVGFSYKLGKSVAASKETFSPAF